MTINLAGAFPYPAGFRVSNLKARLLDLIFSQTPRAFAP
jgi:hypothetical protein